MEIVDANVFVRYITRDDPEKADRALSYLDGLSEGKSQATVLEAIIAEVVFVLSSKNYYALPRARITDQIRTILALSGIALEYPDAVRQALDIYESSTVDFPDALNIAHAERLSADAIVSFDRDYDRFPTVTRREP